MPGESRGLASEQWVLWLALRIRSASFASRMTVWEKGHWKPPEAQPPPSPLPVTGHFKSTSDGKGIKLVPTPERCGNDWRPNHQRSCPLTHVLSLFPNLRAGHPEYRAVLHLNAICASEKNIPSSPGVPNTSDPGVKEDGGTLRTAWSGGLEKLTPHYGSQNSLVRGPGKAHTPLWIPEQLGSGAWKSPHPTMDPRTAWFGGLEKPTPHYGSQNSLVRGPGKAHTPLWIPEQLGSGAWKSPHPTMDPRTAWFGGLEKPTPHYGSQNSLVRGPGKAHTPLWIPEQLGSGAWKSPHPTMDPRTAWSGGLEKPTPHYGSQNSLVRGPGKVHTSLWIPEQLGSM
ncbi:hypothetical protein STEG23_014839 [Scotinomys teguina]